jgi:hypothetical protein
MILSMMEEAFAPYAGFLSPVLSSKVLIPSRCGCCLTGSFLCGSRGRACAAHDHHGLGPVSCARRGDWAEGHGECAVDASSDGTHHGTSFCTATSMPM